MTNTPRVCRSGERCQVATIGELIYCVVHHSDIPPKQIADLLDMRVGYLLDAANPDRDDTQFQLRKFLPLVNATGRYDAMEALAGMLGGVFFRLPRLSVDNGDVVAQAGLMLREFSDVLAATAMCEDVTPQAAAKVAKEGREAIAEIARTVQLMESKVQASAGRRAALQVVTRG